MLKDVRSEKWLKQVGERLRARRLALGITLEEVETLGWPSWRHFQKMETGGNMTLATLYHAARLLKIDPKKLI